MNEPTMVLILESEWLQTMRDLMIARQLLAAAEKRIHELEAER